MSASTTTQLEFKANTAQAQKDIKDLGTEVKNTGEQTEVASSKSKGFGSNLGEIATIAAGTVVAVKAIASAAKECIDAFAVQEQAEAKLNATLMATGQSGEFSMEWMKDLASNIQSYTTFGDEAVLEAERILLATKALNQEGFERTIALSADLAAAMGTDISSAANILAKALVEPGEGLNRLKSIGVTFTEDEEALIASLMEANDTLGAQDVILKAVEERYSGVARAIGETDTGKLTQISNTWGDIKENLGAAILQSISPALDALLDMLNAISAWQQEHAQQKAATAEIKAGGSEATGYSGYTNEELKRAYESYNGNAYMSEENVAIRKAIADEIAARGGSISYGGKSGTKATVKFAKGGIVTEQIDNATVGEAGPEAIIPLNSPEGRQILGGTTVNITIQGNADEQKIYEAIERAQRTGALPGWRYAQ